MITKDLGAVSAYAYAVEKGYTGTEAEYAELMASYATVAQQASQSAQSAGQSAANASQSATDAETARGMAQQAATDAQSAQASAQGSAQAAIEAAQTATRKAGEAAQSAQTATEKAQQASASATDAETARGMAQQAATDAQSAQASAQGSAQAAIEAAQTATRKAGEAAQSAQTATEKAQQASASAQTAQTAQQTATAKASEAQQSATTATTKAQEASQSASESSQSAQTAVQAKQDAQTAKTASETAQASAESARDDAESARDEAQQYAESINPENIYSAYPTDTASGSVASFADGADNIPMKSVKVRIEPVQDLHGQDTPYPAGGGKNLLETTGITKTENGVTFTVNPDGSVLVNGTATEQANFRVNSDGKLIPAGTQITVSGCPANGSMDTYSFWATTQTYLEYGGGVTFTPSEDTLIIGRIRIAKGYVCNNLLFKPQIEKGSAKTSWSPYSNICPISGWSGAQVVSTGVNVWDEEWERGSINNDTGLPSPDPNNIRAKNYCSCKPNTTYFILSGSEEYTRIYWYDAEKNFIFTDFCKNIVKTSPENARYFKIRTTGTYGGTYNNDVSVNYPSTDHDYHPYSGNSLSIPLPQTVYGGELDVTNGVLTVDRAMVDLGTLTFFYVLSSDVPVFRSNIGAKPVTDAIQHSLTSIYPFAQTRFTSEMPNVSWMIDSQGRLFIRDDSFTDVTTFKTAVTGQTLVYELATSITLTLSPTEIKSLLADNNIWADTGDTTAIYRADTTLYINRKIAEAISALS